MGTPDFWLDGKRHRAAALSSLLHLVARIVNEAVTRGAIARAFDVLSWDGRGVITEGVLAQPCYDEGLTEQLSQARQDIARLLEGAPLLADLTRDELRAISQRLRMEHFARGDVIIRHGDRGDWFYIIRRGRVQVAQWDAQGFEQAANQLKSGDYFGEAALSTGAPRNATVRSLTSVSIFTLSKRAFDLQVRANFRARVEMDTAARRAALLRGIPIFSNFDNSELRHVVGQLENRQIPGGEIIFEQGNPGDKYYIIEAGQVAVETSAPDGEWAEQARLGPSEYFGEIA